MASSIKTRTLVAFKIFSLLIFNLAQAQEPSEALDALIFSTEKKLEQQKKLKNLLLAFEKEKTAFSQGQSTKKQAVQMVRTARTILEIVLEQHLQYLLPSDYMEELTLFSSIAGKNKPTRP